MLSEPQLQSSIAKSTSFSLGGEHHSSPTRCDSSPAIAVTRPSLVSALVDDNDLSLLRSSYYEENRNRSSSLCVSNLHQINNQLSRSAQNSPKLQRKSSFRTKKRKANKSPSHNAEGYEPLNSDFANEASQFSVERVTSVQRVLSRTNSFTSSPTSPRPYRAKMSLVPAKHRVVQSDSSDDDEDFGDDLNSPIGESSLDFGSGSRTPSRVSMHQHDLSLGAMPAPDSGQSSRNSHTSLLSLRTSHQPGFRRPALFKF